MSEQPRVLGVLGSPRQGGNSAVLVDEVLDGAQEVGAAVERIVLSDHNIVACRACDACTKTGVCIQQDDMAALVEQMLASDVWVLGTPVYWWGPSAQLKTFVDRWYGPWHSADVRTALAGKRAVLVTTMGDTDPATARHVIGMFTDAFKYMDMKLVASVVGAGVYDRGDAVKRAELLDAAHAAGRNAVADLTRR